MATAASAAWYWPFGSDDDEPDKVRLSVLMEPASELIDEASDLASDGKVQESVEKYRRALEELERIEAENPERVKSQEFATVRNKRAYVNAAIDAMLLSQVRNNAKPVAVSDTTELEKKLAAERKAKEDAAKPKDAKKDAKAKPDEKAKEKAKDAPKPEAKAQEVKAEAKAEVKPTPKPDDKAQTQEKKPVVDEKPQVAAKPKAEAKPRGDAKLVVKPLPKVEAPKPAADAGARPAGGKARVAYDLAHQDYADAEQVIATMLDENANDLTALNLKAAVETAQGQLTAAEATLDRAIMANPRSHYAYYNMALLVLKIDPAQVDVARRYYETGRTVGGPKDPELEGFLK